jgi:hypothetical protein
MTRGIKYPRQPNRPNRLHPVSILQDLRLRRLRRHPRRKTMRVNGMPHPFDLPEGKSGHRSCSNSTVRSALSRDDDALSGSFFGNDTRS